MYIDVERKKEGEVGKQRKGFFSTVFIPQSRRAF
jgi:hypothetical protein